MITNKVGKVMAIIIYIIFVLIMGTILYLFFKEDQVFTKEGLQMVNIVDKAKETDGDKFIHYKVEGASKDSKELIAVHFNTNSENNIGFIDEYGNVVKEPFLSDPYYDYFEKENGDIGISSFDGAYYIDYYRGSYYNRNFEKVHLTDEKIEEIVCEKNEKLRKEREEIPKEDIYELRKSVKELTGKEIKIEVPYVSYNGEVYTVWFAKSLSMYYILLDSKYNLLTELYYFDGNENQFCGPKRGSKVGCAFVRGLGKVYYNTNGDIIWITYCRDKATK